MSLHTNQENEKHSTKWHDAREFKFYATSSRPVCVCVCCVLWCVLAVISALKKGNHKRATTCRPDAHTLLVPRKQESSLNKQTKWIELSVLWEWRRPRISVLYFPRDDKLSNAIYANLSISEFDGLNLIQWLPFVGRFTILECVRLSCGSGRRAAYVDATRSRRRSCPTWWVLSFFFIFFCADPGPDWRWVAKLG